MKPILRIAPLLIVGLAACHQPSGNDPETPERVEGEHLLSGHERQIQRARNVEDQVLEAAERQRREIDEDP